MIAWIALALAALALSLWLVVAYTLRRVWRTVGPQVAPLLAMFGGAAEPFAGPPPECPPLEIDRYVETWKEPGGL